MLHFYIVEKVKQSKFKPSKPDILNYFLYIIVIGIELKYNKIELGKFKVINNIIERRDKIEKNYNEK